MFFSNFFKLSFQFFKISFLNVINKISFPSKNTWISVAIVKALQNENLSSM